MATMNASLAGLRVLHCLLKMDPKTAGHELSRVQPFLTYPDEIKSFEFIRQHLSTYGTLPHAGTLLDQLFVALPGELEPYDFEYGQLKNRFIEEAMRAASDKAILLLNEGKAQDALLSMVSDLLPVTQNQSGVSVHDLRKSDALSVYQDQLQNPEKYEKTSFMWPSLDNQGGIEDGDMVGVVGRPGSGKTWVMLRHSLNYWAQHQEPVLFVTQEMSAEQIEKRLIPMFAQVNPTPFYRGKALQYELGKLTHEQYWQALQDAQNTLANAEVPYLIYDSKMAGTVSDIENIAALHGARRVWIDGAYMLRHPDTRMNRYQRVPENLDRMKFWGQRTGVSITSSWQFKRGAGKDDAGDIPDLDDIGYSHAIGEYMSIVLGLLENPKSVNQMNKKHITIMKGRSGEQGGFNINWHFDTMNFDEISVQETQSDLSFL